MAKLKPILIVDDSINDVELTTLALQEDGRIANKIEAVYGGAEGGNSRSARKESRGSLCLI